ncbi:MAG: hypothetical protein ACK5MP_08255, partial [Nostocoides sp.]
MGLAQASNQVNDERGVCQARILQGANSKSVRRAIRRCEAAKPAPEATSIRTSRRETCITEPCTMAKTYLYRGVMIPRMLTVRTAAGDLAGTIAPPWAVDSNGVSVPTEYIISGNTVVQRVYPSVSTAYPVVADPFWIPALMVMAHLTRHAITQAA